MAEDESALAALPAPGVRALWTRLHRQADRERALLRWRFLDQLPPVGSSVDEERPGSGSCAS